MKKKLFGLLVSLALVVACVLGFTACQDGGDGDTKQPAVDVTGKTATFTSVRMLKTENMIVMDEEHMPCVVLKPGGTEVKSADEFKEEYSKSCFDAMEGIRQINEGKSATCREPIGYSYGMISGDFAPIILYGGTQVYTFDDIMVNYSTILEVPSPYYYEYSTETYYAEYYTIHMFMQTDMDYMGELWGNLRGNTLTLITVACFEYNEEKNDSDMYVYEFTFTVAE